MTEESLDEEDILLLNIYTYNRISSKRTKEKLTEMQENIDEITIIVKDFIIISQLK